MADVEKTLIINKDTFKVIRLALKAGASVPEHSANAHVVVIPVKGQGTFTLGKESQAISAGKVLEMEPNVMHAVQAETDLEIMVIQIRHQ